MSISARAAQSVRRCGFAPAVMAAFLLGAGACARHAAAPAVVEAAPDRPPAPALHDAAVEHPIDAPVDAAPDAPGPSHGHAHRSAPAPRAPAAGGFKVEGSIGKADAETVLRGARSELDACYEKERAKDSSLAGRVTFRLSIDGRGRVPLAELLTSTLGGGDPELCMVEALRDLQFPPSSTGGESTLTFPMTFGR